MHWIVSINHVRIAEFAEADDAISFAKSKMDKYSRDKIEVRSVAINELVWCFQP